MLAFVCKLDFESSTILASPFSSFTRTLMPVKSDAAVGGFTSVFWRFLVLDAALPFFTFAWCSVCHEDVVLA